MGVCHLLVDSRSKRLPRGGGEKEPERQQRRINRRATMATMCGKSSSPLLWQDYSATYRPGICTTASPALSSVCGRNTFLIAIAVRLRYRPRVAGALICEYLLDLFILHVVYYSFRCKVFITNKHIYRSLKESYISSL